LFSSLTAIRRVAQGYLDSLAIILLYHGQASLYRHRAAVTARHLHIKGMYVLPGDRTIHRVEHGCDSVWWQQTARDELQSDHSVRSEIRQILGRGVESADSAVEINQKCRVNLLKSKRKGGRGDLGS